MCFNISIVSSIATIEQQFNAEFHANFDFMPQEHISAFTNPQIPVITSEDTEVIQSLHWGLIPHWVKDQDQADTIRRGTYNARSETVREKTSFRSSIEKNKCLVITNGFYEWQTTSSGKVCHYITRPGDNLFAFAGIWSGSIHTTTGKLMKSVSILTQSANKMMAEIHNIKKRQPVILHEEHQKDWMDSGLEFGHILEDSFAIELSSKIVKSPLKRS